MSRGRIKTLGPWRWTRRKCLITGRTVSTEFPTTPGAFQATFPGQYGSLTFEAAFVTKVNASGSGLVYSTYLGSSRGARSDRRGGRLEGSAYVTGMTRAKTFPTTPGAYDTTYNPGAPLRPTRS